MRSFFKKIVKERVGFKAHFTIYCMVNTFIWMIWFLFYFPEFPWAVFTTVSWGVGLLIHFFQIYWWMDNHFDKEYQQFLKEKELENLGNFR